MTVRGPDAPHAPVAAALQDGRALFDHLPDAVVVADTSLRCRWVNRAALTRPGQPDLEGLTGRRLEDVLQAHGLGYDRAAVDALSARAPQRLRRVLVDERGTPHVVLVTSTPLRHEDRVCGVLVHVCGTTEPVLGRDAEPGSGARTELRQGSADQLCARLCPLLFAATLELSASVQGGPAPAPDRVRAAILAIDMAIRELRTSVEAWGPTPARADAAPSPAVD